jgi:hypothetical protein
MAKSMEPGSTSISGTVNSEGGHKTTNAVHKGKLMGGGGEALVSSEYAQITSAMRNPAAARISICRRIFFSAA